MIRGRGRGVDGGRMGGGREHKLMRSEANQMTKERERERNDGRMKT